MENRDFYERNVINDYLRGKLSKEEEYELERASQKDPFLAEALEGLSSNNKNLIDENLEELHTQFNAKKHYRDFRPYKIAAGIAVLLSVSVGIYFIVNNIADNHQQVADQQPAQVESNGEDIQPINEMDELAENQPQEDVEDFEAENNTRTSNQETSQNVLREEKAEEQILNKQNTPRQSQPAPLDDRSESTGDQEEISLPPPKNAASSLSEEMPAESENISPAHAIAKNEDALAQTRMAKKADQEQPSVTESSTGIKTRSASSEESVSIAPKPEGGFEHYQQYIDSNIRIPDEAAANGIEGRVTLSFTLLKGNEISNVTVVKGLGHGWDEEAKRLLLNGPSWTANKLPASASYTFHFSLPE